MKLKYLLEYITLKNKTMAYDRQQLFSLFWSLIVFSLIFAILQMNWFAVIAQNIAGCIGLYGVFKFGEFFWVFRQPAH